MDETGTWWIIIGVNFIWDLCLCLIIYYYLVQYFKQNNQVIIQKRYPKLLYVINIMCCLFVIIDRPLLLILRLSNLSLTQPIFHLILVRIYTIIYPCTAYGTMLLILCRFWLIYYDINYCNSISNKKWTIYLNPNLMDNNFWLRNKTKYSSRKFTLLICFCVWLIIASIFVTTQQISLSFSVNHNKSGVCGVIGLIVNGLMWILFTIIPTIITILSPKILDIFYLRYEIKIFVVITWSTAILMVAVTIIIGQTDVLKIVELVSINVTTFNFVIFAMSTTYFVMKKIEQNKSAQDDAGSSNVSKMSLNDVLIDSDYFELFSQHLCNEFAMELLLCFCEMVQFKCMISEKFNLSKLDTNTEEEKNETNGEFFDFYSCDLSKNMAIPKSSLVHYIYDNDNVMVNCLQIAYDLYEKYINDNGDLVVNISGEMKQLYNNEMISSESWIKNNCNSMEANKLFEYFDAVVNEMYQCLLISFERYAMNDKQINVGKIVLRNMYSSAATKKIITNQK